MTDDIHEPATMPVTEMSEPVLAVDSSPSVALLEPVPEPTPEFSPESVLEPMAPAALLSPVEEDAPDEPVPVPESATEGATEETANPDVPPAEVVPEPSKKRWYVVKVQSGREESIKAAVERKMRIEGLEEFFGQIVIPVERHQELRRGKRVTKSTKLYPGYLFAEVEYNDRILYLFRETSGVGDFVGGGIGKPPTPMPDKEVERMLHRAAEPVREIGGSDEGPTTEKTPVREPIRVRQRFSVGDRLRVIDGNFSGMEGEVVDLPEERVRVVVSILGRPLSLDLEYWQVEAC